MQGHEGHEVCSAAEQKAVGMQKASTRERAALQPPSVQASPTRKIRRAEGERAFAWTS